MNNVIEIKIRGYHLDLYGHVNNARYLEFLEEARWTLIEGEVGKWMERGLSFFIVNINISYRSPAVLGMTVEIHSTISKYGRRSCVITQRVRDRESGRVIAEADVTFVIADASGKAIPIEGEVLESLKRYGGES